jgi:hypothetical protein
MDDATFRDFTAALGESYCDALARFRRIYASPQDGYEVFVRVFGKDNLSPETIHTAQVSKARLTQLRDVARSLHEDNAIELEEIQETVRMTLWRWPPSAR